MTAIGTCVADLEQQSDRTWSGRVVKTGETKTFNTLDDYKKYIKSLEQQGTYCANVDAKYLAEATAGKNTTPTGFMEFQARDPVSQARFSAMSPTWEGIESSESAIARGDYDLERAEKNRQDLRSKKPKTLPTPSPVETSWNCSIQ
jgi:hypothetical protein